MMKKKLESAFIEERIIKIAVTSNMIQWDNEEHVIRIQFDDCLARMAFDDVYPYWRMEEKYRNKMLDILSEMYVKILDYDGEFTLEHSSLFLEEENAIHIGKVFPATIVGCTKFNAFCKLKQGNIVMVGNWDIPDTEVSDVRKIFIPGDNVKLIITKCMKVKKTKKYYGSLFVPGRKFTGKEGQMVRARVGAKDEELKGGVFATVLGCGEERKGVLNYPDENNSFSEGEILIVKILEISGRGIKLEIPQYSE